MRNGLSIILCCIAFLGVWDWGVLPVESRVEPEEFACQREHKFILYPYDSEFLMLELDEDPVLLLDRWFRTPDNPNHILEPGQEYPNRVGDKWYKAMLFSLSDAGVFVGKMPLKDGSRVKERLDSVQVRSTSEGLPESDRITQPHPELLVKTFEPEVLKLPFIADGKTRIVWLLRVALSLSPECKRKERPMIGKGPTQRPLRTILYLYTNAPDPNNIHSVKFFRMWKVMAEKSISWILERPSPLDVNGVLVMPTSTLKSIELIREYLPRLAIIPEEMEKAIAELEAKEAADKAKQEEGAAAASNKAPETPAGNPK